MKFLDFFFWVIQCGVLKVNLIFFSYLLHQDSLDKGLQISTKEELVQNEESKLVLDNDFGLKYLFDEKQEKEAIKSKATESARRSHFLNYRDR